MGLIRGLFIVCVALLCECIVEHEADSEKLGSFAKYRGRVKSSTCAVVQGHVRVVLRRKNVGNAVAIHVTASDILIESSVHVAGVAGSTRAGRVRREAIYDGTVGMNGDQDIRLAILLQVAGGDCDQLQLVISVDVLG